MLHKYRFVSLFVTLFLIALPGGVCAAATIDVVASSQTLTINEATTVIVSLDTGGDAINAGESTIVFSTEIFSITSLTDSGLFSYWAEEPSYSNDTGTISFSGGLPDPGYTGTDGVLIEFDLRADAPGSGQVCVSDGRILKNDGLGTDVFSGVHCLDFVVQDADTTTPAAPIVSSTTHPNQNTWYALPDLEIFWETLGTGVSFILDTVADTIPDDVADASMGVFTQDGLADGIWYFHIKAENDNGWGATTHFNIRIDTEVPTVVAEIVDGDTTKDTTPDIFVTAYDDISDIDYVDIIIDGILHSYLLDELSPLTLQELGVGKHTIIVRAYDLAGNSAEKTLTLTIEAKTILDRISDTVTSITKPIQDFISDTTAPIRNFVNNLRQNQDVIDSTQQIAEPIARTAAAIGVAAAVATLPIGLINALFAFLRFVYLFLSPLFIGKRGKSWGTVINSITRRPIGDALVRVFETEFNKMKESQITDPLGRFGFLVDPGVYTVTAEKQGFVFPSHLVKQGIFGGALYTGGKIHVDDKKNPHITVTIPLDPDEQHITMKSLAWKKVRDAAVKFLDSINWPLLGIGTVVSVWSAVVVPDTTNTLLLMLYVLLIILKIIRAKVTVQSFGVVADAETKEPLGLAVVRIFNAEKKVLVTTRITNEQGKFSALVQPGSYYLVVTKPPYQPYQSTTSKLSKSETLAMDVELVKSGSKFGTQQVPPRASQAPTQATSPGVNPPTHEEVEKNQQQKEDKNQDVHE